MNELVYFRRVVTKRSRVLAAIAATRAPGDGICTPGVAWSLFMVRIDGFVRSAQTGLDSAAYVALWVISNMSCVYVPLKVGHMASTSVRILAATHCRVELLKLVLDQ